ncbi:MAG: M48 family metallopeptidase [Myxococcota bacterium]
MTGEERREQQRVLAALARDARVLAARFELELRSIEAERANVRRRYGVCYSDGSIRIRLRHARTGRVLKYSSLVDTLCHELAHLRHFDHGARFKALYQRILGYARRQGIYRPRLPAARAAGPSPAQGGPLHGSPPRHPRQLELFGVPPGISPRRRPSRRALRASSAPPEPRP